MQLRSGAPGQQGGHLAQLIQEVLELEEEYKNVSRQREQIFDYRLNYLKKRPNKLIKFDSEEYYETPREGVGLLERFRRMSPAIRAEADAILADPDWIYLNESDERLRLELKRLFDSIGEKRQFIGYGKPRMRGGMRGPPGGTANLGRDAVAEEDLRSRALVFTQGLRDIARRKVNIIKRHGPFISLSEDDLYWLEHYPDPTAMMRLERYMNHKVPRVRQQAAEILQDEEWQDLTRIEQNIRPMRAELGRQLADKVDENRHNQQMAVGEGKPSMRGGMLPGEANAPPPASIPKPRRVGIPQPMNIDANGVALPLNAHQQAVSDVLAHYALIIEPLWQSIRVMQEVGAGRVLDTQANRIIIHDYEVAVADRRAAIQQIMQADQDQDMIGNGRSHMDRGRMWHDMRNRRY
jgi:hypothetical protein